MWTRNYRSVISPTSKFECPIWPLPLMLVIIYAKYGNNPFRTVHAVEQTKQDVPYFSSCIAVMAEWSWRYRSKSKVVVHGISPQASDQLCQIYKESIENSMGRRANMTRCAIIWQFYSKVMAEWPWRYRSGSKVIIHETPYYTGNHLHLIWKNPSRTVGVTEWTQHVGQTNRGTDGVKPVYPINFFVQGYTDYIIYFD